MNNCNQLKFDKKNFSIILNAINCGIISLDNNGFINFVNETATKILKLNMDDILNQNLDHIEKTVKYSKNYIQCIKKIIKEDENELNTNNLVVIGDSDKEERILSFSLTKLFNEKLGNDGYLVTFDDVTTQVKLEREMLNSSKMDSIKTLAGGIAHDFNNILTGIIGNINFAKNKIKKDDFVYELLDEAETSAYQATNLTEQLLTFSKGGNPVKTEFIINELIEDVASFTLRGTNIEPEISILDKFHISADYGQIYQVISNLLINSVQAIDSKSGKIKINIEKCIDDFKINGSKKTEYIKIEVIDNGKGIQKRDCNRIFDPFYTTKDKGSGLGLAICYSIIKKHEGTITVESEIGKSTKFTIYFPLVGLNRKINNKQKKDKKSYKGNGTVMLMDDNESIRRLAEEYLKNLGYKSIILENGEEVLEVYKKYKKREKKIDAVILDLTVKGGMGGKDTFKELIKMDKNLICIVSSGYSNDKILNQYREYGFKGVLTKPYKMSDLGKVLYCALF